MRKDSTNSCMQKKDICPQGSKKKAPVAAAVMVAGALMASTTSSVYAEDTADDSSDPTNPIIVDAHDVDGLKEYKHKALKKIEKLYNKAILGIDSISEDPAILAAREKMEGDFKDLQKRIISSTDQREVSQVVADAQMLLDSKQAIPTVIDEIASDTSGAPEVNDSIMRLRDEAETEIHEAIKDVDILLNSLSHISPSQYKNYRAQYTSDDVIEALKSEVTAEGIDRIKQTALEDIVDCKTRIQARKDAVDDAVSRIESQYESSLKKINDLECITSDEGRDCRFVLRAKKDRAVFHIEHLTDDALGRAKEIADKYIETESNIYNPLFEINAMRSRYADSFRDKTIACRDMMRDLGDDERYQIEYGVNELRKSCSNAYLELCQKKTEDACREVKEVLFAELDQILDDTVAHKELADQLDGEAEKVKTAIDKLTWLTKKDRVNRKAQIDVLQQGINFEVDNIELKDQIDGALNSMADCLKTAETLNTQKIEARNAIKHEVKAAEAAIKTVGELSHIGESCISDLLFIERDAFDQIDDATTADAVADALTSFNSDYSQKLDEVKSVNHKYSEQKEKFEEFIGSNLNRFRDLEFNYQGHNLDQLDDVESKKQKLQEIKAGLSKVIDDAEKTAYSELAEALDLEDIALRGEAELKKLSKVSIQSEAAASSVSSILDGDTKYHDLLATFKKIADDGLHTEMVHELNGYFTDALDSIHNLQVQGILDHDSSNRIVDEYHRSCDALMQRAQEEDAERTNHLEALLRKRVKDYLGEVQNKYQNLVDDIYVLNGPERKYLQTAVNNSISDFTKPGGELYTTPIKELSDKVYGLETSLNQAISQAYRGHSGTLLNHGMNDLLFEAYALKQGMLVQILDSNHSLNYQGLNTLNEIDMLALLSSDEDVLEQMKKLCDEYPSLPGHAVSNDWYENFTKELDTYADQKKADISKFSSIPDGPKNYLINSINEIADNYKQYPSMIELTEVLDVAKKEMDDVFAEGSNLDNFCSEHDKQVNEISNKAMSNIESLDNLCGYEHYMFSKKIKEYRDDVLLVNGFYYLPEDVLKNASIINEFAKLVADVEKEAARVNSIKPEYFEKAFAKHKNTFDEYRQEINDKEFLFKDTKQKYTSEIDEQEAYARTYICQNTFDDAGESEELDAFMERVFKNVSDISVKAMRENWILRDEYKSFEEYKNDAIQTYIPYFSLVPKFERDVYIQEVEDAFIKLMEEYDRLETSDQYKAFLKKYNSAEYSYECGNWGDVLKRLKENNDFRIRCMRDVIDERLPKMDSAFFDHRMRDWTGYQWRAVGIKDKLLQDLKSLSLDDLHAEYEVVCEQLDNLLKEYEQHNDLYDPAQQEITDKFSKLWNDINNNRSLGWGDTYDIEERITPLSDKLLNDVVDSRCLQDVLDALKACDDFVDQSRKLMNELLSDQAEISDIVKFTFSESRNLISSLSDMPQSAKLQIVDNVNELEQNALSTIGEYSKDDFANTSLEMVRRADSLIDQARAMDGKVAGVKGDLFAKVADTKMQLSALGNLTAGEKESFISNVLPFESSVEVFKECLSVEDIDQAHNQALDMLSTILEDAQALNDRKSHLLEQFDQDVNETLAAISGNNDISEDDRNEALGQIGDLKNRIMATAGDMAAGQLDEEIAEAKTTISGIQDALINTTKHKKEVRQRILEDKAQAQELIAGLNNLSSSENAEILSEITRNVDAYLNDLSASHSIERIDEIDQNAHLCLQEILKRAQDADSLKRKSLDELNKFAHDASEQIASLVNVSKDVIKDAVEEISNLADGVSNEVHNHPAEQLLSRAKEVKDSISNVIAKVVELDDKIKSTLDTISGLNDEAAEKINALANLSNLEKSQAHDKLHDLIEGTGDTVKNSTSVVGVEVTTSNIEDQIKKIVDEAKVLDDEKSQGIADLDACASRAKDKVSALDNVSDNAKQEAVGHISSVVDDVAQKVTDLSKDALLSEVAKASSTIEVIASKIDELNDLMSITLDSLAKQKDETINSIDGLTHLAEGEKMDASEAIEKLIKDTEVKVVKAESAEDLSELDKATSAKIKELVDDAKSLNDQKVSISDKLSDAVVSAMDKISACDSVSDSVKDAAVKEAESLSEKAVEGIPSLTHDEAKAKVEETAKLIDVVSERVEDLNDTIKATIDELVKLKEESTKLIESLDSLSSAERETAGDKIAGSIEKAIDEIKNAASSGDVDQMMQDAIDSVASISRKAEESNNSKKQAISELESAVANAKKDISALDALDDKVKADHITSIDEVVDKAVSEILAHDAKDSSQKVEEIKGVIAKLTDESKKLNEDAKLEAYKNDDTKSTESSSRLSGDNTAGQNTGSGNTAHKEINAPVDRGSGVSDKADSKDTPVVDAGDLAGLDVTVALDTQFEDLNGVKAISVQSSKDNSAGLNVEASEIVDDDNPVHADDSHENADIEFKSLNQASEEEDSFEMSWYKVVIAAVVAFILLLIGKRRKNDK